MAFTPATLCAVIVIGKVPLAVGVPLSISVAVLNKTPVGKGPDSASVGAGKPVTVTLNVPRAPKVNVVLLALVIAALWSTFRVKLCVASALTPLCAVIVIGKAPLAVGVPLRAPVAVLNKTPDGNAPVSASVGTGYPVAVILNNSNIPKLNVELLALVIAATWFTVRVKLCVASPPTPLWVVNVIGKMPLAVGVPLRIPVAVLNKTPVGNGPVSASVGAGEPVAVTLNDPNAPKINVVLLALLIAAAWFTARVKLCVASPPTPLWAVNVIGKLPLAVGVPLKIPVAVLNKTPVGIAPVSDSVGAGNPVAMTLNDPNAPNVNVVLLAVVIAAV